MCELGNLNDYIANYNGSMVEVEHDTFGLGVKRRSSLLVKSASGVPMVRESKIWQLLREMLLCLKHVHASNIVHLDIKPSNFLITALHEVKLADFGCAVDLSRHEQDIEQMGDSVYMAPELLMTQKALNERVSFKSDVFSLGASMLQIASGMTLP